MALVPGFARPMLRLAAAIVIALQVGACGSDAPKFRGTDVSGTAYGRGFELVDHTGKARTLADYRGKVVVVFFGYTQCPDVCPTTMAQLAEVMRRLGPDSSRVQVLFITVDPDRDTRELLAQYVPAFNPSFVGLSGDADATARTAKEFRIFFQKQPGREPGTYTVDHSTGSFVFDSQGRLRLYMSYGQAPEAFEHDIRELLRTSS